MLKDTEIIKELALKYFNYRDKRISLISSENVSSKLLLSTYLLGLSDQYCSRLPSEKGSIGNLAFGNMDILDDINHATREIVKEVYKANECEIRLLSGVNGLTVLLYSLFEDGDLMFKMDDMHGGHLSVKPIAERLKIQMHEMKLGEDYRLDIDSVYEEYRERKPKVIFLDSSYVLFPYPLSKIKEFISDDTIIVYDASHMSALIAANRFQNPFAEGADIIHSSTHKTLWGPQKSMILFKEKSNLSDYVHHIVKDILVSNTHLHHIFSLLVALIEFKKFGNEYADSLINNAKYFAECLDENGLDIVAKKYGYTESNQFWINFETKENAIHNFKKLEKLNISTNMIFLPNNQWGLRIGVNELTRFGADDSVFKDLARLISDAVYNRKDLEILKKESLEIKSSLSKLRFSFDDTEEGKELIKLFTDHIKQTNNGDYCIREKLSI